MAKINVMFMQSQSYFGSDSMIHSLIMRNLDRSTFEVHAAVNNGSASENPASLRALQQVPRLNLRPTHFGTSINFRTKRQIVGDTIRGGFGAAGSLAGLVAYARRHKIDIIHGTEKPRDAFYGYLISRLAGAAMIIHLHVGVDHRWMLPLTIFAMRRADGLLGVSEFVAESARRHGYNPKKVYYALNSLDASRWDDTTDGTGIRQELGISPDTMVISIISRVCPWKGHTQLLQALAQIKPEFANWKLLVVGEDDIRATPGHHSYTAELRGLTRELGLDDHIIFTGFRKDIAQILAASDIYAMPSYEEPCAVAFLEAMAMRKPIIALASGGTPQLVDHGKAGLLSTPYDVDELAANLRVVLKDRELCQAMGRYARQRVLDYYNPQRMTRDVEQIYHQVLASRWRPGQSEVVPSRGQV